MLYVSVGSTCNVCIEDNPENATMLQVKPDGSSRRIFASGLCNTIGFAFQPQTGQLYGWDHGIDWLGDDEQPEEMNLSLLRAGTGLPHRARKCARYNNARSFSPVPKGQRYLLAELGKPEGQN
jgi:hypothetical protein